MVDIEAHPTMLWLALIFVESHRNVRWVMIYA